jgi:uncharacterized protein YyaL (SSP411 family)
VLHVVEDGDFADLKKKMFDARSKRVRPHLDDKVLTSWNALMISAMAQAGRCWASRATATRRRGRAVPALRPQEGRQAAPHLAAGRGEARGLPRGLRLPGAAMLDLYEATFDAALLRGSAGWSRKAIELFWDEQAGGFYTTAKGHESLIARMREEYEGRSRRATP